MGRINVTLLPVLLYNNEESQRFLSTLKQQPAACGDKSGGEQSSIPTSKQVLMGTEGLDAIQEDKSTIK